MQLHSEAMAAYDLALKKLNNIIEYRRVIYGYFAGKPCIKCDALAEQHLAGPRVPLCPIKKKQSYVPKISHLEFKKDYGVRALWASRRGLPAKIAAEYECEFVNKHRILFFKKGELLKGK